MKKKILGGIAIIAIAAVAAFNVNLNNKNNDNSPLLLANIEAWAQLGGPNAEFEQGPVPGWPMCVRNPIYGGIAPVRNCSNCGWTYFVAGYSSTGYCKP
jgi:hypothetical protein